MLHHKDLIDTILSACQNVYDTLGYGLDYTVYQNTLAVELTEKAIPFELDKQLPFFYHGKVISTDYTADIVVNHRIILRIFTCSEIPVVLEEKVMNHMKATGMSEGYLLCFNQDGFSYKRFSIY